MKKTYLFLIILSFLVSACHESFLEEEVFDFVAPSNFYNSAEDALAAINSVYRVFNEEDPYYQRNLYFLTEMPTEMVTTRLDNNHVRGILDIYTWNPQHEYIGTVYAEAYKAINRANAVIDNVPGIGNMDNALRERIVGEAKFLRALHYFNLVRLYGEVPLITKETIGLDDLEKPKVSIPEIYDQIIFDLQEAISILPVSYPASDLGRATKGAAQALLAKVFLQRGQDNSDFQEVVKLCDELRGAYSLLPNVADVFDQNNENNAEVIFDIQNISTFPYGGRASAHLAPVGSQGVIAHGAWSSYQAELPFYRSYSDQDARKSAFFLTEYTLEGGEVVVFNEDDPASDNYVNDGPAITKVLDDNPLNALNRQEPNLILLRYADVLLMKAEALNELNSQPDAEAYTAINEVRQRAGLGPLEGLDYEQFRRAVFQERRWELVFEHQGFFDGQRFWDLYKEKVEMHSNMNIPNTENAVPKLPITVEEKFRYYPLPQGALDRNPALKQNPLW